MKSPETIKKQGFRHSEYKSTTEGSCVGESRHNHHTSIMETYLGESAAKNTSYLESNGANPSREAKKYLKYQNSSKQQSTQMQSSQLYQGNLAVLSVGSVGTSTKTYKQKKSTRSGMSSSLIGSMFTNPKLINLSYHNGELRLN